MNDWRLWLRLVLQWKTKGMGTTGPTIPFLLGATRLIGIDNAVPDAAELSTLLFRLQGVASHYVRIAKCQNIQQPVVAMYERNITMDTAELVGGRRGGSSLYVSCHDYPHTRDVESVSGILWPKVESALAGGQYSFSDGRYGGYSRKERTFIHDAASELKNDRSR